METLRNVVVVSDLHAGCGLGLFPPEYITDNGNILRQSAFQKKLWDCWLYFINEYVPMATKGEPYALVVNGDVLDGVHHNSVTQITANLKDQREIAKLCLQEFFKTGKCEKYLHIRGTEAHIGKSGQDEEEVAADLGAIPDENGNHARWELWLELGPNKLLGHFTHHVGTTSSAAYESTAVYKELIEAYNEAGRWDERPPDFVVRSHRHRQFEIRIPTDNGMGIVLVTPGWQGKTPFVYRGALGRSGTPQIGGYVIRCGDDVPLYTMFQVWKMDRTPTVSL